MISVNFFLNFLSASVWWAVWSTTTLCPVRLKCLVTVCLAHLGLMVDRWLLILLRSSPYVFLVTYLTNNEVDAVVRATGCVHKNSVASSGDRAFITVSDLVLSWIYLISQKEPSCTKNNHMSESMIFLVEDNWSPTLLMRMCEIAYTGFNNLLLLYSIYRL